MSNHNEAPNPGLYNRDDPLWESVVGAEDHAYSLQCMETDGQNLCSTQDELLVWLNQAEMLDHFPNMSIDDSCVQAPYTLDEMQDILFSTFKNYASEAAPMNVVPTTDASGKFIFVDESMRFVEGARRGSTGSLQDFISPKVQRAPARVLQVSHVTPMKTIRRHSLPTDCSSIFFCPWAGCEKSFNRTFNLKSHYRTHTQEKPYSCNYCHIHFARNHDLKRHMLSHLEEKPFACPDCNKAFSRSDALNRHRNAGSCCKRHV